MKPTSAWARARSRCGPVTPDCYRDLLQVFALGVGKLASELNTRSSGLTGHGETPSYGCWMSAYLPVRNPRPITQATDPFVPNLVSHPALCIRRYPAQPGPRVSPVIVDS